MSKFQAFAPYQCLLSCSPDRLLQRTKCASLARSLNPRIHSAFIVMKNAAY